MSCSPWLRRALVPATLSVFVCFGCTSTGSQPTPGTGGTVGTGGTTASGGTTGTGGATSTGGTTASGGTTGTGGVKASGGTVGTGGVTATGGTTGSAGASPATGGTTGAGGIAGGGGRGGGHAGATGTGTGGTAPGTGGSTGAGGATASGGPDSVAYIGCSMAYNIGTGYKRVGGKVMWNSDNYQTSAMVVQNWTSSTSSSWSLFDQKMQSIGGKDKVKAVMIQICIFSSRATDDEVKSMIMSARSHTNPGTHFYLVGQPQYEAGHECSLAGTGGAVWTDDEAKKIAADTTANQDLTYLGQFKLDSTKGEVSSDSCHATTSGEDTLGKQAMAFFGG